MIGAAAAMAMVWRLPKEQQTEVQLLDAMLQNLASAEASNCLAEPLRGLCKRLEGHAESIKSADKNRIQEFRLLARQVLSCDLAKSLVFKLSMLSFEARKDACRIFLAIAEHADSVDLTELWLQTLKAPVVEALLSGCADASLALHCGGMLRLLTASPATTQVLFDADAPLRLLSFLRHPEYEVAAEAFATVRAIFAQRELAAKYVELHFAECVTKLLDTLRNGEYTAQRQVLCLLAELLFDEAFTSTAKRYTNSARCLKVHMDLLLHDAVFVRLEGFRTIKAFVKQPLTSGAVHRVLLRNKEKLLQTLDVLRRDIEAMFTTTGPGGHQLIASELHSVADILQGLQPMSTNLSRQRR